MPKADKGKGRTKKPKTAETKPPADEPPYRPMSRELPPGIARAEAVLAANFDDLYARYPGDWVACDGERVRYIGNDWQALFDRCLEDGLKDGEFIVRFLLPEASESVVTWAEFRE